MPDTAAALPSSISDHDSRAEPLLGDETARSDQVMDADELTDAQYLAKRKKRTLQDDSDSERSGSTILQPDAIPSEAGGGLGLIPPTAPAGIEEQIQSTSRLFLRNVAFTLTDAEIRSTFAEFGTVSEVLEPHCVFLYDSADSIASRNRHMLFKLTQDHRADLPTLLSLHRLKLSLPTGPWTSVHCMEEFCISFLPGRIIRRGLVQLWNFILRQTETTHRRKRKSGWTTSIALSIGPAYS